MGIVQLCVLQVGRHRGHVRYILYLNIDNSTFHQRGGIHIPAFVFIGVMNSNTPQQNAGVFIGQTNNGGWDADMKFQAAKTGNFNIMSVNIAYVNIMNDNMEFIDGVINDQDFKPDIEGNI